MSTAIHRQVEDARAGRLTRVIGKLASGWAVLGDPQILPGYCLLLPDPVVGQLNDLAPPARQQFLEDMTRLGDVVLAITEAERVNYEILGNVEPALHAHIVPRYSWEPPESRRTPVWLHDWNTANAFNPDRDDELLQRLAAALKSLQNP